MKTLLIDNYDSFTYNLYHLIAEVNRVPPVVVRNNVCDWEQLALESYDNIVISPGPGTPENPGDFGICTQVIREAEIPILGVCLGHQGLCLVEGGQIDYANTVMHGRLSAVHHLREELFKNMPSPFNAVRYHSLVVSEVPDTMDVTAYTADGTIMAVRHKFRPLWGVQFHPESICTEYGTQLLRNYRDLTVAYTTKQRRGSHEKVSRRLTRGGQLRVAKKRDAPRQTQLFHRQLPFIIDPECAFKQLFSSTEGACFWLDSALLAGDARFSYMGNDHGPLAERLSYRQALQQVQLNDMPAAENQSLFAYLRERLAYLQHESPDLPFDFNLGFVGYLGYEMKADCGYPNHHQSRYPDAQWLLADRMLVFDHVEEAMYLVCLDLAHQSARAEQWLDETEQRLCAIKAEPVATTIIEADINTTLPLYKHRLPEKEYLAAVDLAKQAIKRGETYEVCLTNTLSKNTTADPVNTYLALRRYNPAPYAAFLQFGDLTILSSSPERFVTINRQGLIETKPIKGTRRRLQNPVADEAAITDLQHSEKDRSENLMIVDLLRNDLSQVAEFGSVQVKKLFAVESYATVHQLVSTIQARLRRDADALDCIHACFPGGSMTGAPKKRTLEILDTLEKGPRGIYSGNIGFLGLNGCADLNIVIRTLVIQGQLAEIGVGGAIVDLSSPQAELEEMLLKSEALVATLAHAELNGNR